MSCTEKGKERSDKKIKRQRVALHRNEIKHKRFGGKKKNVMQIEKIF
jgi:hypothetical protein